MAIQMQPTGSWLFTPATRPDRFAKAAEAGADVLVIDLEDAVAAADKGRARLAAFDYLAEDSDPGIIRALRINALDTQHGVSDMALLLSGTNAPDFLVLPKAESAAHIQIVEKLLAEAKVSSRLVALIESARGLAAVEQIAAASPRLYGLLFGAADMAADLGTAMQWEPLAHARGKLIAACAMAGIAAIDSPWFDIQDVAGLQAETARAVAFGFVAKAAIHPSQIKVINTALTPSEEELGRALAILAESKKGVGVLDGLMVDEAMARKAKRVIAARRF
ncbi:itaconate degradation C-C-lyase RipC [Serratia entomophila]|uniref:itaconate degradation C-C-lyase RipC n=1 Tax=Serratia entomophila TaxID=42906 RepID=UPI002177FDDD|nr:itaconate degradation C-C-lyase RipC [Serratia entomophila]CAI0723620.1 Malyl-CoA lyase [Serratia entomophila]CAI0846797.1 Malyl-CoA lyase [Serratia entomophila]CAI0847819.1 Malyl-CoA lyase [Serratia entomophila]CAI0850019.1 Malyl-CoA lyase [Serratia entomophila]CAI1543628.1 Malyl-CoA lyase [Serratia entomophila]